MSGNHMRNCQTDICKSLGNVLSKEEIDLGADGYRLIDEDKDVEYLNCSTSVVPQGTVGFNHTRSAMKPAM